MDTFLEEFEEEGNVSEATLVHDVLQSYAGLDGRSLFYDIESDAYVLPRPLIPRRPVSWPKCRSDQCLHAPTDQTVECSVECPKQGAAKYRWAEIAHVDNLD